MQGTVLNQRYRIIKILGAGGFGQTYLANDIQNDDAPPCVVKQFKPASKDTAFLDVARRLFNTEAKILERLGQHELIPTFIDFFEENKEFYLVQEFIDGTPLSDAISDGLRFNEEGAIVFLKDVLSVLDFVHRNGVIHRDVKPENLIRRHSDGRYVLIDFGAVKEKQYQLANQTRMTRMTGPSPDTRQVSSLTVGIGTEGYNPPEQLSGRPRHCSDIYALGITTIQVLTGMPPYEWGEDPDTGELEWQDYAVTSIGFGLILETMIRLQLKHRYSRASDVLSDLQKLSTLPEEYTTIPDDDPAMAADMASTGDRGASLANTGLVANRIKPRAAKKKSRWASLKPVAIIGAATVMMSSALIGARQLGWFQALELAAYDRLVQVQANFGTDERLLVVEITEQDLRELQLPTPSDTHLSQVLQTLQSHNPLVIGIDLHRELPQGPTELHQAMIEQIKASGAIAITFLGQGENHIPPPLGLPDEQVGFNDLTIDVDGVVRRSVLIGRYSDGRRVDSFAFQLAIRYLAEQNIFPDADPKNPEQLRLGQASLPRLDRQAGQYHNLDNGGYQIILDYRSEDKSVRTVRFTDVLKGDVRPDWIENNIVFIGTTATSGRDRFLTPFSANQTGAESDEKMPGVVIHAQMVSQLLDVALGTRSLRWYWSEWGEILWIVGWAVTGSVMAYYCRHPILLGVGGIALVLVISGTGYVVFGQGGWIPTLMPCIVVLATGGTTVVCRAYFSQRKEEILSSFLRNSRLRQSLVLDDFEPPRNER